MQPTTYELAMICATLARNGNESPAELTGRALLIWEAAANRLAGPKPPEVPGNIRYDELVSRVFPSRRPDEARKLVFEFLQHHIASEARRRGEPVSNDYELESQARGYIENYLKPDGVPYGLAEAWAQEIPKWHRANISSVRAYAAREKAKKARRIKENREAATKRGKKRQLLMKPEKLEWAANEQADLA